MIVQHICNLDSDSLEAFAGMQTIDWIQLLWVIFIFVVKSSITEIGEED